MSREDVAKKFEQVERNRILADDIKKWRHDVAVEFIEFIKFNYPEQYVSMFMSYEEWLRGN